MKLEVKKLLFGLYFLLKLKKNSSLHIIKFHVIEKRYIFRNWYDFLRFPVPGDCGRLITCVDGHPRLLTCGDGKLFDSVSLTCLDPEEVPHWFVYFIFIYMCINIL